MAKGVALFYGSTTGNTERVAELIRQNWPTTESIELVDIAKSGVTSMIACEKLIIGAPTWDFGELQEDWRDEWPLFCQIDFTGKRVALFGVGDQIGYPEWFQDAMGLVGQQVLASGGELIGYWPNQGYSFESSLALTDDGELFCGLVLDEDSQSWATEERVAAWVQQVVAEFQRVELTGE